MNRTIVVIVLARLVSVNWAKENGISDGTNLNDSISREQIATMLYRYAGSPKIETSENTFSDSNKINSWTSDAMNWAINNGLISGMGDGTVNPKGQATCAQIAAIIQRFVSNR